MEHMIQFGITIDDKKIKDNLEQSALKQLCAELNKDVKSVIFETNYYSGRITDLVTDWTKARFYEFLTEHKDEIINEAAKVLAEKLARSKAAKTMLEDVINGDS